jgi:hypothetical protein
MRPRRTAIGTTIAVLVALVIVVGGAVGFVLYTSLSGASSTSGVERSGPISTYPASWTDACGLPVQGNLTTNESFIPSSTNITLNQVYSDIINSANFTHVSVGLGWVTTSWSIQEDSGPGYSYEYVIGQFVLLNASHPDGYVQGNYNLETGAVTVIYNQDLVSNCPAIIVSTSSSNSTTASTSQQESTYCTISGQPGPIFLRVVSDSNSNQTIAGAQVAATNEPAYCDSSPANSQTTFTFTTNSGTEWYALNSQNDAGYSFVVTYAGQTYNFTAALRPLSATCVTLFIPSGRTSVSILGFQTSATACTSTTTNTTSSLQQPGSLSWDASYGVWNYEVTLTTNQIQQGQNITAIFTLTNFSNETQTVDLGGPLVLPTIYSQDGKVVWAYQPSADTNAIQNITAGQAITEQMVLPTWMLQADQSYILSTCPDIGTPDFAVNIGAHLQLNQTIIVA